MLGRVAGQHGGVRLDGVHAGPQHAPAVRSLLRICQPDLSINVHEQGQIISCTQCTTSATVSKSISFGSYLPAVLQEEE